MVLLSCCPAVLRNGAAVLLYCTMVLLYCCTARDSAAGGTTFKHMPDEHCRTITLAYCRAVPMYSVMLMV